MNRICPHNNKLADGSCPICKTLPLRAEDVALTIFRHMHSPVYGYSGYEQKDVDLIAKALTEYAEARVKEEVSKVPQQQYAIDAEWHRRRGFELALEEAAKVAECYESEGSRGLQKLIAIKIRAFKKETL